MDKRKTNILEFASRVALEHEVCQWEPCPYAVTVQQEIGGRLCELTADDDRAWSFYLAALALLSGMRDEVRDPATFKVACDHGRSLEQSGVLLPDAIEAAMGEMVDVYLDWVEAGSPTKMS